MTVRNTIEVFKTVEGLNEAAAKMLLTIATKSVAERGRFVISLSGGNTPKSLYALLALPPYRDTMPWKNTFIFWGDERCVPANDESNNAHMAKTVLLNKVAIPPGNIFAVRTELPPAEAAEKYEETLHTFFKQEEPHFDFVLLGLGDNGHTASLFPETAVLNEEVRWVKEVFITELKTYRVTMTAPLINMARHITFLVTGEDKASILNTVLNGAYLPEKYPAQLIAPTNGEIRWLADVKAAGFLAGK